MQCEHAAAAAVRRVLADGHVNPAVDEHRRADDLARANVRAVVAVGAVLLPLVARHVVLIG